MVAERDRQIWKIELIASENYASRAVLEATGSWLTNKYAEGQPGKRYYGGCEYVDVAERLAEERALALFPGAEFVNVQPHSGAQANMAAYLAVLDHGDTLLGMSLAHGGHLTHGHPINFSGRFFDVHGYGVSEADGRIDYDALERQAREVRAQADRGRRERLPSQSSTSSAWAPSLTRSTRCCWWTWPTSPAWWQQANTPAPSRTLTS